MGPADERRHQPGGEPGGQESWAFDFVAADGSLAGFVRLTLHRAPGRAWYWAYVTGTGRPLVVVRDHEVEAPRGRDLEVRAAGLWAQVICETPLEHWSAGLEAFAVALDPGAATVGDGADERGDPVALGLDLEWEMAGDPAPWGRSSGYLQPAGVHGDVLVGAERLNLDGVGWYAHRWGPPCWAGSPWWSVAAHLGDGTAVATSAADGPGWSWPAAGGAPSPVAATAMAADPMIDSIEGEPRVGTVPAGDRSVPVVPVTLARVPVGGGRALTRAVVRATPTGADGDGWGWAEWR